MQAKNYVFIALEPLIVTLHIENLQTKDEVYVECSTVDDIVAAFKAHNVTQYDDIYTSSDVEFATEFGFADDDAVFDMLDEAYAKLNFTQAA